MANAAKKSESPRKPEAKDDQPKKRTVLSPEQKLAKAETELQELRKKIAERDEKKLNSVKEKRDKLVERRDKLSREIAELDAEVEGIENRRAFGDRPLDDGTTADVAAEDDES